MARKNNLKDKINTNGFDKNPQNINRTGANGRSITKCLKELLNNNIAEVEIIMTAESGEEKRKKFKLQTKGDFNELLAALLLQKAVSGDLRALIETIDRTDGRPTQRAEIEQTNVTAPEPLTIKIVKE